MTQSTVDIPSQPRAIAPGGRRMVKRVVVDFSARLHTVYAKLEGTIADISAKGAKLQVGGPVELGGSARLVVEGQEVFCDVMWSDGDSCGIKFERDISDALLETILHDATETFAPVACTDWIPMGVKRGGKLVCEG